jgi:hypothetical protein
MGDRTLAVFKSIVAKYSEIGKIRNSPFQLIPLRTSGKKSELLGILGRKIWRKGLDKTANPSRGYTLLHWVIGEWAPLTNTLGGKEISHGTQNAMRQRRPYVSALRLPVQAQSRCRCDCFHNFPLHVACFYGPNFETIKIVVDRLRWRSNHLKMKHHFLKGLQMWVVLL